MRRTSGWLRTAGAAAVLGLVLTSIPADAGPPDAGRPGAGTAGAGTTVQTPVPEGVPATAVYAGSLSGRSTGLWRQLPSGGIPRAAFENIRVLREYRNAADRPLGEPTGEVACAADKSVCRQQYGQEVVVWSSIGKARSLHASVSDLSQRPDLAYLGLPVGSEYRSGDTFRTDFQHGSLIRVPKLGRIMTYDPRIAQSAVVVGDSQAGPDTWVGKGLSALGYTPVIRGAGGTGYVQGNGTVGSYPQALKRQEWLLPWGDPRLVVLQGGGNDAGATDAAIRDGALQMIREMRRTYPASRLIMVGVIAGGSTAGSARRVQMDALLAGVAKAQNVEFLSIGDWWGKYSLGSYLQPDGRHFTAAGHTNAGKVFARELGAALARPPKTVPAG